MKHTAANNTALRNIKRVYNDEIYQKAEEIMNESGLDGVVDFMASEVLYMLPRRDVEEFVALPEAKSKRPVAGKNQAENAYQRMRNRIDEKMARITALMDEHSSEEPVNWAHVGDLAHVDERLDEIIGFMGGDTDTSY